MKRYMLTVLLILSCAAIAGEDEKMKFPYAGKVWNQEVTMTKLELMCLKADFEAAEPFKPYKSKTKCPFVITRIESKPTKGGIAVVATAKKHGKGIVAVSTLQAICRRAGGCWVAQAKAEGFSYGSRIKTPIEVIVKIKGKVVAQMDTEGAIKTALDPK